MQRRKRIFGQRRALKRAVQRHRVRSLLMNPRPIRSDREHAAAVAEILKLLDANRGTEAADSLVMLGMLVEEYEERHFSSGED